MVLFFLSCIGNYCTAQTELNIFRITSTHTSFPDTGRANGHTYKNILYKAADHYSDSSVLIITPKKLAAAKTVDIIFWFHGWGNNIDSANKRFELAKQFASSNMNAILVLSETTKDAPDSYGGKLEQSGVFKSLVNDVIITLKREKIISRKTTPGNILLAGHSGAYRVMAHIVKYGDQPIQEVILFDALYGQTDKFMNWILSDIENRFINIYTDEGGTDMESKEMVKQLLQKNIIPDTLEEKEITPSLLQKDRIIFIHSLKKHNDIINNPDNFELFIRNSAILNKLKK